MYPVRFEYHRARSVQEAIGLLSRHEGAKPLAGGHSLIPLMKLRLAQPPVLVDIGRIAELRGIEESGGRVSIGALTTHAELAASTVLQEACPLLAEAAAKIGDPQVRHKATIGGNIAHADPASDLPAVLLALEASFHLVGPNGERAVPATSFFVDLLTTEVGAHEILTRVEVPRLGARTGSCYLKCEHPASGYAVCGAAALLKLAQDGTCSAARLCFNGVTATPLDASQTVATLAGKRPDDEAIDGALAALEIAHPLGDLHASGSYRVELARVYGRRALRLARDRGQG